MKLRAALCAGLFASAGPAAAGDYATGDWGGLRSRLEAAGVQLEAHYTAEAFVVDEGEDLEYRGNLDLMLTLDTQALGAWPGGELFVYGQHGHGRGVSERLGLLMPVSNLEAESFTQLSELWLEQRLGGRVRVRLGKQDANRDFANPRFPGNFVNSSYGVLPGAPLPSFPAPALGAAMLVDATPWLGLRAGVYEGAPEVESFAGNAFDEGTGLFAVGALVLRHALLGRESGVHSLGAWTHTASDRWGAFGVLDWHVFVRPGDPDDGRSLQLFLRGGWSPERAGEIGVYAGGGLTAHDLLGLEETFGVGAGHARSDTEQETFVEAFVKLRLVPWFTLEPNVQLFDAESGHHAVAGLRLKLKL